MDKTHKKGGVLCAVDFEHNSLAAERIALKFAHAAKTDVVFFHTYFEAEELQSKASNSAFALPLELIQTIHEEIAKEKKGQLHWRVAAIGANEAATDIQCKVSFGDPVRNLQEFVKHNSPELLVLSKRRRSFFSEFMLGSIGNRILRDCHLKTLIVPDDEKLFIKWEPQQITVALSFDLGSRDVWREAYALAQLFGASLRIVHVALSWEGLALIGKDGKKTEFGEEVQKFIREYEAKLNAKIENFYKEMNIDARQVPIEIRRGSVATQIFEVIENNKADLIVIGASDAGKGHLKILGSVASTVARSARLPVLVVQENV